MIICEREFDRADPKNPDYSMTEVDYYAWIPAGSDMPNHRLSLRKNLKTGKFEVYRHYFQRHITSRKSVIVITGKDTGLEEVAFSGTLQDAIDFAHRETNRFWAKVHGKDTEKDQICQHKYPVRATSCGVREGRK